MKDCVPHKLLTVVIPARNEAECIADTLRDLSEKLRSNNVPHEIIVVDDASLDQTCQILTALKSSIAELNPIQNLGPHGFGHAIICGINAGHGDCYVIMMADQSDDCCDVIRYWNLLNQGYDCVFGSRFIPGGKTINYPWIKLRLNRFANTFICILFGIALNDTTNAFKAYTTEVIAGCKPLESTHFELTVELPLKAIVRGYRWTVIPTTWTNRTSGVSKLKIREMGSRYLRVVIRIWIERFRKKRC